MKRQKGLENKKVEKVETVKTVKKVEKVDLWDQDHIAGGYVGG